MTEYKIDTLKIDYYFSRPLFLDEKFILCSPEMTFSQEILEALKKWDFDCVHSEGEEHDNYQGTGRLYGDGLGSGLDDEERLKNAEAFYKELVTYTGVLYSRVSMRQPIVVDDAAAKAKEVCDFVRENQRYILQAMNCPREAVLSDSGNAKYGFLAAHSAKTSILAAILGITLKLPMHRVIELTIAALVHEVGMTRLPMRVYMKAGALDVTEKKAIFKHPEYGFDILKNDGFPITVCVPALEHHERENGAGYPRKLTSDKISYYSKIISVVCSYEAITSSRPHKDASNPYTGMIDMLRNDGKRYDDTILRALVTSLSLFPIGLYVRLSNGKTAQVIDVNPEDPRFPVVCLIDEQTPDGKNKILKTSRAGIHIDRPLDNEEITTKTQPAAAEQLPAEQLP